MSVALSTLTPDELHVAVTAVEAHRKQVDTRTAFDAYRSAVLAHFGGEMPSIVSGGSEDAGFMMVFGTQPVFGDRAHAEMPDHIVKLYLAWRRTRDR